MISVASYLTSSTKHWLNICLWEIIPRFDCFWFWLGNIQFKAGKLRCWNLDLLIGILI